jgi:hypothetical protein
VIAVEVALTVSVEFPPAFTEVGFSDAVTPVPGGLTLALRLMLAATPLVTAVGIVLVPELP